MIYVISVLSAISHFCEYWPLLAWATLLCMSRWLFLNHFGVDNSALVHLFSHHPLIGTSRSVSSHRLVTSPSEAKRCHLYIWTVARLPKHYHSIPSKAGGRCEIGTSLVGQERFRPPTQTAKGVKPTCLPAHLTHLFAHFWLGPYLADVVLWKQIPRQK